MKDHFPDSGEKMDDCEHDHVQTWRFEDGKVAMWSCIDCAAKFEPIKGWMERKAKLKQDSADLLEALQSVHQWLDDQSDAQSKGGHATFDLRMLREQRDKARAAIARATHKEQT